MRGKGRGFSGFSDLLGITPAYAGKSTCPRPHLAKSWITPAYAGKSCCCYAAQVCRQDHPRVCGEKFRPYEKQRDRYGITPAYAGKRFKMTHYYELRRDHPRVCGEKHRDHRPVLRQNGSPPRMRGKETCKKACEVSWGITPAYAGKRLYLPACPAVWGDHPRVCGEKSFFFQVTICTRGSPPRMRGKVSVGFF